MNREFGDSVYVSSFVEDCNEGYAGFELNRIRKRTTVRVAKVIYWDACGQFVVETFGTEVPVEIIEDLIAEAKTEIKVR